MDKKGGNEDKKGGNEDKNLPTNNIKITNNSVIDVKRIAKLKIASIIISGIYLLYLIRQFVGGSM